MLEDRGEVLETARRVTEVLKAAGVEGGVVGGVAVFLHGYRRTTADVDVFTPDTAGLKKAFEDAGFVWSDENRGFYYRGGAVPVQILTDDVVIPPRGYSEIEGVRVIRLADLITMKVDSGANDAWRHKDISDVIELMRVIGFGGEMAAKLHPKVRRDYRELVKKLGPRRS